MIWRTKEEDLGTKTTTGPGKKGADTTRVVRTEARSNSGGCPSGGSKAQGRGGGVTPPLKEDRSQKSRNFVTIM